VPPAPPFAVSVVIVCVPDASVELPPVPPAVGVAAPAAPAAPMVSANVLPGGQAGQIFFQTGSAGAAAANGFVARCCLRAAAAAGAAGQA
jgi:hypothetical protein